MIARAQKNTYPRAFPPAACGFPIAISTTVPTPPMAAITKTITRAARTVPGNCRDEGVPTWPAGRDVWFMSVASRGRFRRYRFPAS
ncbi:hypothetical protein GCM10027089_48910 [Nocardia thraciensis]